MKKLIINIATSFISLMLLFIVLEVSARVYKSEYRFTNFLGMEKSLMQERSFAPTQFHPELGWIPKPGSHRTNNGKSITISGDGTRANGIKNSMNLSENSELILAVGDSFTFGSDVSDDETWPSLLENGVDQSFLRMKMLAGCTHNIVNLFLMLWVLITS
jgi:hypothetical protein